MTSRQPEDMPEDRSREDAGGARPAGEGNGPGSSGTDLPPTTQWPVAEPGPGGGGPGGEGPGSGAPDGGGPGGGGPGGPGGPAPYGYDSGPAGQGPAVRQRSKMKRIGAILSIVGGAVLVLSIVAAVIMAVSGIGGAVSEAQNGTRIDGTGSVELEADEDMQVYIRQGAGAPMCNISGPAGASIEEGTPQESTFSRDGTTWTSYTSFTVSEAGSYDMACSGGEVIVGPPVSVGGIMTGVGGIMIGVFGGGLGFILLVVGLVLFFVGRSRERAGRA